MKLDMRFFIKSSIQYVILAGTFSIIGIFLPTRQMDVDPLSSLSIEHVLGHITWGLIAGTAILIAGITIPRLRYFFLSGAFAILLDADHLINFLWIEITPRMSHSIIFGVIAAVVMIVLFSKRDYILGAVAFSGVLTHMSFDTFSGGGWFPLFTPVQNEFFIFQTSYWILFELAAIMIIGLTAIKTRFTSIKLESKS